MSEDKSIPPETLQKLGEAMQQVFEENQKRPHQYVVAYKRISDDSLIGYHLSTWCQMTPDILLGKRYAGENPYPQLETIARNFKYIMTSEKMNSFISPLVKDIPYEDIYIDAIYLAEGTPKQQFTFKIINAPE